MISIRTLSKLYKPYGSSGQWIASTLVCLSFVSMGISMAWPEAALPLIRSGAADFTLDTNQESAMVAVLFVANIITPFILAYMLNALGKRKTCFLMVWFQVISWVLLACGSGFVVVMVARFLMGVWAGLCLAVILVYVGEVMEPQKRGAASTLYPLFMFTGSLLQALFPGFMTYRQMSWFSVGLNLFIAAALCIVPETPYYYLERGDMASAAASLTWLRGRADPVVLTSMSEHVKSVSGKPTSYLDLFKGPNLKSIVIVELLGMVQRFSGMTVLISYISVTLPDSWVTAEKANVVVNVVWLVSSVCSSPFMDKVPRRTIMFVSCLGNMVFMSATSCWFYLRDQSQVDVSGTDWLPLLFLSVQGFFYCIGIITIPGTLQSEMFSPHIKNKASTLTSSILGAVSAVAAFIYLPLQRSVGTYVNFAVCAVASFIGILLTSHLMIETKGKSLEEIQLILSQSTKLSSGSGSKSLV